MGEGRLKKRAFPRLWEAPRNGLSKKTESGSVGGEGQVGKNLDIGGGEIRREGSETKPN